MHVRGSQTRRTFSVDPDTISVPVAFIAKLYMESLSAFSDDADNTT